MAQTKLAAVMYHHGMLVVVAWASGGCAGLRDLVLDGSVYLAGFSTQAGTEEDGMDQRHLWHTALRHMLRFCSTLQPILACWKACGWSPLAGVWASSTAWCGACTLMQWRLVVH